MAWFKEHLHWTYLFCIFLAVVVAGGLSFVDSNPLDSLQIYLDEDYSQPWSENNIPDLEDLKWQPPSSSGWEDASLVVYLENLGRDTLEIEASATESPLIAIVGFYISSDSIILGPDERSPISIEISRSPFLLSMTTSEPRTEITIYFLASPVDQGGSMATWVVALVVLLLSSGWVLHQKRRSYAWLLLSLSLIGIIIIFLLKNKRPSLSLASMGRIEEKKDGKSSSPPSSPSSTSTPTTPPETEV